MNAAHVHASQVFQQAAALMGMPWSGRLTVDPETFGMLQTAFGQRWRELWEAGEWPELITAEWRQRLPNYHWQDALTTYPAGAEVLDAQPPWRPYRAMRDVPGGIALTNPAYWLPLKVSYPADTFQRGRNYSPGEVAFFPPDGQVWWCMVPTTALPSALEWFPTPVDWRPELPLGPADPVMDYVTTPRRMGHVLRVSASPDMARAQCHLNYDLTDAGVRVQGDPGRAWVRYRRPSPNLDCSAWSPTRGYVQGAQVYYEEALADDPIPGPGLPVRGDFYELYGTSAFPGEAPPDHPDVWRLLPVQARFSGALAMYLAGDWLQLDGQMDKSNGMLRLAQEEKNRELTRLELHERQSPQLPVSYE